MPKLKTTPPNSFIFENLSLAEQVRRAMPHARRFLHEGIKSDPSDDFNDVVNHLAQDSRLSQLWEQGEDSFGPLANGFAAARAVGIALGLLLHPEAFEGGAR